jgi:hypothetical protein
MAMLTVETKQNGYTADHRVICSACGAAGAWVIIRGMAERWAREWADGHAAICVGSAG